MNSQLEIFSSNEAEIFADIEFDSTDLVIYLMYFGKPMLKMSI
ncbi:MAG: hypothetical protein ABWU13_04775 [Limnospira maxima]